MFLRVQGRVGEELTSCFIDELIGDKMGFSDWKVLGSKLSAKTGSELAHFTTSIKANQADPEVPVPIIGRQTMSTCAP